MVHNLAISEDCVAFSFYCYRRPYSGIVSEFLRQDV